MCCTRSSDAASQPASLQEHWSSLLLMHRTPAAAAFKPASASLPCPSCHCSLLLLLLLRLLLPARCCRLPWPSSCCRCRFLLPRCCLLPVYRLHLPPVCLKCCLPPGPCCVHIFLPIAYIQLRWHFALLLLCLARPWRKQRMCCGHPLLLQCGHVSN
jgi:hypothetical protein